ncbi:hypothetical protein CIW52_29935 [Mycolicibacterium sp. P9-64]|nr:hypothetical protein CIW52_29935 [Mycolicibacterium sp. P9-64]
MAYTPSLNPPRLGDPISSDGELAYVKRSSAQRQAAIWNEVLAGDPVFGRGSGVAVGVAPMKNDDRRWPLVWVQLPSGQRP